MIERKVNTFWAKIYISGPISEIEQLCREFVKNRGLCVTVQTVKFIYTGGEEFGIEIGLINYPKFPKTKDEVLIEARDLAALLYSGTFQDSYLIMTPEKTEWYSDRKVPK